MADFRFKYEKQPERKVAYMTFTYPEKLNALRMSDYEEMARIIHEVNADDDVKVLVMKGEGRAFGSGHDVAELGVIHDNLPGQRRPSQRKRLNIDRRLWGRPGVYQTICWCQKATVCQVQGICYGAQFEFANNSDIVVASEDALFTHPGFRYIGPVGEIGVLIETIGLKRVKEMMLTGEPLTAQEALRVGLINRVVPIEKLEEETEKMVEAICRLPFDGIVMGKANFEAAMDSLGIGSAWNAAWIVHAMQTGIRYEDDEFNLFRARKEGGVTSAIRAREEHYSEQNPKK